MAGPVSRFFISLLCMLTEREQRRESRQHYARPAGWNTLQIHTPYYQTAWKVFVFWYCFCCSYFIFDLLEWIIGECKVGFETHCFCRWRKAWYAARTPTMLALVEQLRSYLGAGGGCECACLQHAECSTIHNHHIKMPSFLAALYSFAPGLKQIAYQYSPVLI